MSNITNFISSFAFTDLARTNRFDVLINMPEKLTKYFSDMPRILSLRCEIAQLPVRNISVLEQKFGNNPVEKHANMANYSDMELTFIVSDNMQEKYFFDVWLELINPTDTFNPEYKDSYTAPITITQYDLRNRVSYAVELVDAFPTSTSQLDLNWDNDSSHKLTVNFAYTYWKQTTESNILLKRMVEADPGRSTSKIQLFNADGTPTG
jgi:hypothetical protein